MVAAYAAQDGRKPERDIESYLRHYEALKSLRYNWDAHWREVAERIWPQADQFLTRRNHYTGGGEKRTEKVFDSTAALALEKFGAILASLLTPKQQRWHKLRTSNEALNKDASVKAWFEELVRILFAVRGSPRAGYYEQIQQLYKSEGAFGNGCQFVDEAAYGGIRYKNIHVGQMYIALDHQGRVDTFYRCFPMSAHAAVQKWGENAGPKVRAAMDKNPYQEFDFLHVVAPRKDRDPQALGPRDKPWAGVYLSVEDRIFTEPEHGYHELPYQYARWAVSPAEVYGRGPAMTVLPNVKVLNEVKKTDLRARHLGVEPPLLIEDDGVFGAGTKSPRFIPGAVYGGMVRNGQPLAMPLNTGADLQASIDLIEDERNTINDAFFVALFRILVEEPSMTATEVLERAQEKGQLLGPAISNLQSELLGPQIERELAILARAGQLPPMPPVLLEAGGEYDIEYVSPATRMQRSEEASGVTRTLEALAPLAAVDPTIYKVFKPYDTAARMADVFGVPANLLESQEDFAQMQQAAAQQAAQAQQMAQMEQMAGAGKDGAQALTTLQGAAGGGPA